MSSDNDPGKAFEILGEIGKGYGIKVLLTGRSYGSVMRAVHKESGRKVAIKMIPVEGDLNGVMQEISMLKTCKSEYIVRYYGSYMKSHYLWVGNRSCGF